MLGGSSGVNGTLCVRGMKKDFDDWGLEGWSGKDMWRNIKKVGALGSLILGKSRFQSSLGPSSVDILTVRELPW